VWHEIVEHTGNRSVAEAKEAVSATEYLRWTTHFENKARERRADHWYWAQLASELACIPYMVWGKQPPAVLRDIRTFLLKFGDPADAEAEQKKAAGERTEEDAKHSESVWFGILGIDPVTKKHVGELKTKLPPDALKAPPSPDQGANRPGVPLTPQSAPESRKTRKTRVHLRPGKI
jgi:hypothetical protein